MVVDVTRLLTPLARFVGRRTVAPARPLGAGTLVMGVGREGEPVAWPGYCQEKASHVCMFAASGAGKSVLLAQLLASEWLAAQGGSSPSTLVVLDAKGDLIANIEAAIAAEDPAALDAVTTLDPFSDSAFGLNLLALERSMPDDIFALVLSGLVGDVSVAQTGGAGTGARQHHLLQAVMLGALGVDHPRASIMLARDALVAKDGLAALAEVTTNERARDLLASQKPSAELRISTAARVEGAFGMTAALERIVTATQSVSLSALLRERRALLVHVGNPTGGLQALRLTWARLLGTLILDHALARPSPYSGGHLRLVFDEAQLLQTLAPQLVQVLTVGRSKSMSLVLATQSPSLLDGGDEPLLPALMGNSARIVGRVPARDADALAKEGRAAGQKALLAGALTQLRDREFVLQREGAVSRFEAVSVDVGRWRQAEAAHAGAIAATRARVRLVAPTVPRLRLEDLVQDEPSPGRRPVLRAARPVDRTTSDVDAPVEEGEPRSPWG